MHNQELARRGHRFAQKILGHHSILTTARYTHLTDQTRHHAIDRINDLMDRFSLSKGMPR